MHQWRPVIERGDGAWIGRMVDGRLGVGVLGEERVSLGQANMVPMWPFMERPLADCLGEFSRHWTDLSPEEFRSPSHLLSTVIGSARRSWSPYWRERAAQWLRQAAEMQGFDSSELESVRSEVD